MRRNDRIAWPLAAACMALLMLVLGSCREGLLVPEGDPVAGRATFLATECHTCHEVVRDDLPAPTADPPVPVKLGDPFNRLSRASVIESIIAPAHRFAKPRPLFSYGDPPIYTEEPEYENIKEGTLSRMGDFSAHMTVKELIDIAAYIDAQQRRPPGAPQG